MGCFWPLLKLLAYCQAYGIRLNGLWPGQAGWDGEGLQKNTGVENPRGDLQWPKKTAEGSQVGGGMRLAS